MKSQTHQRDQLDLIFCLFAAAQTCGFPLWLQGGWAVDARLGRITWQHDDVDLAYPSEHEAGFIALLRSMGGKYPEPTDYGFLMTVAGILVDAEPCERLGDGYELAGLPEGSCPAESQGLLEGHSLRCVSWEAILWDYFHFMRELPLADWPEKNVKAFALVRDAYGHEATENLEQMFRKNTVTGSDV